MESGGLAFHRNFITYSAFAKNLLETVGEYGRCRFVHLRDVRRAYGEGDDDLVWISRV